MIVSHQRRFVFFPDPIDGSRVLMQGLAPFGDQVILPCGERRSDTPFTMGMSPAEVEWAFDAMGIAFKTYLRVAVVQSPFARLARLYARIAKTDPIWVARERARIGRRRFDSWLASTRPNGWGAGSKHSPRWRIHGAWSARYWCGDHISHVIRQEAVADDLTEVLSILGVAPAFDRDFNRQPASEEWRGLYDPATTALVQERYGWDLAQYGYGPPERRKARA